MQYTTVVTGPLGENCYLVWEKDEAWIIDPGADEDEIIKELEARHLKPSCIVLTHGHFDHLGALDALTKVYPTIPVVMRKEELDWAFSHPFNQYPPFYMLQQLPTTLEVAGTTWTSGGLTATFIPTPGHTPGGQCIWLQDEEKSLCFTGDTLFTGSIGRTDLPGGSFTTLRQSLDLLKATLTDATTILPGHGPASTMDREKRTNPYLQSEMDELF
jgi:glyoxylase-like metal-dependent hydrolase (beta-lactamase superfamily II)